MQDEELKEAIMDALRKVIDPETFIDVVTMGLILKLDVKGGNAEAVFRPSAPTCPLGVQLAYSVKKAIQDVDGVKSVKLTVVDYIMAKELNKMLEED